MTLVGFVHYRFTLENRENVLYIYELHVIDGYQGLGIGNKVVQVLETIGRLTSMNVLDFVSNKQRTLYFRNEENNAYRI